jgi:hypothetical protein
MRAHNQVSLCENIASTSVLVAASRPEVAEITNANGCTFVLDVGEKTGGKMTKHYAA